MLYVQGGQKKQDVVARGTAKIKITASHSAGVRNSFEFAHTYAYFHLRSTPIFDGIRNCAEQCKHTRTAPHWTVPYHIGCTNSSVNTVLAILDHNYHTNRSYLETDGETQLHRVWRRRSKRWDLIPRKTNKTFV